MGKLKKGILGLETHQIILLCVVFLTCLAGAALILPQYCPDEWARHLVTEWIYKNKALPLGNEPEIQIGNYGYSYALRPYLTSMVNAVFMMISSLLTPSQMALRVASRFSSVLSVTACYFFCIRTGNLFFRKRISSTVFAIMVVFLPQVMFLGMYQNNDSLGLASVTAVLYFLFYGDRFRWPMKTCVALSIAVSVCLLSYYSIYGWLLVGGIFFIYSFVRIKPINGKALVQKWTVMVIIVVALAGWFFIRNAIIHNGDPFGMATEERNRQELIDQGIEVFRYIRPSETEGNTILKMLVNEDYHWMRVSQKSVIGVFGYLNMFLQEKVYYFYYSIFGIGIVLYGLTLLYGRKEKHNPSVIIVMITAAAITFFLSAWQSFYRDYQAQGRYIITVILPLAYMLSRAGDRITVSFQQKNTESTGRDSQTTALSVCFILLWMGMFFRIFFETMTKMFIA